MVATEERIPLLTGNIHGDHLRAFLARRGTYIHSLIRDLELILSTPSANVEGQDEDEEEEGFSALLRHSFEQMASERGRLGLVIYAISLFFYRRLLFLVFSPFVNK